MATNLFSTDSFPTISEIEAWDKEIQAELDILLGTSQSSEVSTLPEQKLDLATQPLLVGSEEYEDIANSWSNRLGAGVDSVSSMFNEGLGLLADQLGADETAASFRADAAQNLKDRADRPQPKITASITDTAGKISDDIKNDEYLEAAGKVGTAIKATFAEAIPSLAPAVGGCYTCSWCTCCSSY